MNNTGVDDALLDGEYDSVSNDVNDGRDEKLKVVVRVRPLRNGEMSWNSDASGTDDGNDAAVLQSPSSMPTAKNSMRIQVS